MVEDSPPHSPHTQTVPVVSPFANPGPSSLPGPGPSSQPFYKPVLGSKKEHVFNVKVIKATMNKLSNGKVEFVRLEQTFVSVDKSSANINTITKCNSKEVGS